MCLFTASIDDSVDVHYLQEWLLVNPEAATHDAFVEVQLNGFVRKLSGNQEGRLTFLHPGRIWFSPHDGSTCGDLTSQWVKYIAGERDWVVEALNAEGRVRIKSGQEALAIVRYRTDAPPLRDVRPATNMRLTEVEERLPNVDTATGKPDAIYSVFELILGANCPAEDVVFRLAFRTDYGYRDYHRQQRFSVEGPGVALARILRKIRDIEDTSVHRRLEDEVRAIDEHAKPQKYDVFVLAHNDFVCHLDGRDNASPPSLLEVNEPPSPPFISINSPTPALGFDLSGNQFRMNFVLDKPSESMVPEDLQAFMDASQEVLGDEKRSIQS